jgi:hypothetical protein
MAKNEIRNHLAICYKMPDVDKRRHCVTRTIEKYRKQIPYFDRDSIFHLFYGLSFGLLSTYFQFAVIGALLVIPISLLAHYFFRGVINLNHRNAFMDLVLTIIGFLTGYLLLIL